MPSSAVRAFLDLPVRAHSRRDRSSRTTRDLATLLAGVIAGGTLVAHGLRKFTRCGIGGVASSFATMGIPLLSVTTWFAALVEPSADARVLGGPLPVAGVLLALNMLGAGYFGHLGSGFLATGGGIEYVPTLAAASLALGFGGPRYALQPLCTGGARGREAARSGST